MLENDKTILLAWTEFESCAVVYRPARVCDMGAELFSQKNTRTTWLQPPLVRVARQQAEDSLGNSATHADSSCLASYRTGKQLKEHAHH